MSEALRLTLDHLAVAGATLSEAREHVEQALGVALQPGGAHDVFHTHNALLGLEDGLYLEAIAIDPAAPAPGRARWFDLDRLEGPPRLTNWICRADDLEGVLAGLAADFGAPVALRRGDLSWRMAVPQSGVLPFDNCAPALMQWETHLHPAARLAPRGVRLLRLTVSHPRAAALGEMLSGLLADDRLAFEAGPARLHAAFVTPHGPREIGG
jgi:hypothetical protein